MPEMSADCSDVNNGLRVVATPQERIKALSQTADSLPFDNSFPIKRYWRSGKELLRMANIYKQEQSLEKAFILYMKYITLFVDKIPKHLEYKTCDANEKAITKNNCRTVFPIAEQLKTQLLDKYQKEFDLYLVQKRERELEEEVRNERQRQELSRRLEAEKERELQELQMKLNKQIDQQKSKPEVIADSNQSAKADIDLSLQLTNDSTTPVVDRSTKPSLLAFDSLRKVIIPQILIDKFLLSAKRNTISNIETCAILAGQLRHNAFTITHVILPKQRGTADSCLTDNEEEVFIVQDKYDLLTFGWIHTHPSQSAFMSSIDLHTHYSYQKMLSESIAIVCAPLKQEVGVYSLTDPYGLQLIASCRLSGFHPHPTEPPIYGKSSHVVFDDSIGVELIDLR